MADKAREVAYDIVPQKEGSDSSDLERGGASGQHLGDLGSWAKGSFKSVKNSVAHTAAHLGERAKSLDLGEQAKGWQSEVTKGFGRMAESASSATSSASAVLSEKGKEAQKLAKDLGSKSQERFNDAKGLAAAQAKLAKDRAAAAGSLAKERAAAAGSLAKGALSKAGENLQGFAALTMSPAKLAQFGGLFLLGLFLISMSLSFLPMLVIAPQKFALLFAFGSMTLFSSLAVLKGPKGLLSSLAQRNQLPFSVAYVVSLVGTLVATIIMKSFVLTAIFGITQAIALLYFLASYVPGGKMLLDFCGKCCTKCARTVCGQIMRT